VLTWEQGKQQSITLGGSVATSNYKLVLTDGQNHQYPFTRSTLNSKGFYVYSINLPNNFPLGAWFVKVLEAPVSIIAGVKVVPQLIANPVQTPIKLEFILLVLAFVLAFLAISRFKQYENFEILKADRSQVSSALIRRLNRFRGDLIGGLSRSISRLLFERESEYLYQISSFAWASIPFLGVALGFLDAARASVTAGVLNCPPPLILLTALLGLLDPFAGFMAAAGFASYVTLSGHVTSVRSIIALIMIGLLWFAPTLLAARFKECIYMRREEMKYAQVIGLLSSGILGALIFSATLIFFNSLLDQAAPIYAFSIPLTFCYAVALVFKFAFEQKITTRYLKKDQKLAKNTYQIGRVISPRAVVLISFLSMSIIYIWTRSLSFSVLGGCLLGLDLALLLIRLNIGRLAKFKFSSGPYEIILEPLALTIFLGLIFFSLKNLPYLPLQKGQLFILITLICVIAHGVYTLVMASPNSYDEEQS
jgi:hypothetical protein